MTSAFGLAVPGIARKKPVKWAHTPKVLSVQPTRTGSAEDAGASSGAAGNSSRQGGERQQQREQQRERSPSPPRRSGGGFGGGFGGGMPMGDEDGAEPAEEEDEEEGRPRKRHAGGRPRKAATEAEEQQQEQQRAKDEAAAAAAGMHPRVVAALRKHGGVAGTFSQQDAVGHSILRPMVGSKVVRFEPAATGHTSDGTSRLPAVKGFEITKPDHLHGPYAFAARHGIVKETLNKDTQVSRPPLAFCGSILHLLLRVCMCPPLPCHVQPCAALRCTVAATRVDGTSGEMRVDRPQEWSMRNLRFRYDYHNPDLNLTNFD